MASIFQNKILENITFQDYKQNHSNSLSPSVDVESLSPTSGPKNSIQPYKSQRSSFDGVESFGGRVWSEIEEQILFSKYLQLGSKWTLIAQSLINKNQNMIKNKFYGAIRKLLRRINLVGKKAKRLKKLISYESIMRPLEVAELGWDLYVGFQHENLQLRDNIISCSQRTPENLPQGQCLELIQKIHKFNLSTRCFSLKKSKREIQHQKKGKDQMIESNHINAIQRLDEEPSSQTNCQHQANAHQIPHQSCQALDLNVLMDDRIIEQLYNQHHPHHAHHSTMNKDGQEVGKQQGDLVKQILWEIQQKESGEEDIYEQLLGE